MKRKKTLISNRNELSAIKDKLFEQVKATEQDFASDFSTLSSLLEMSGTYNGKKNAHIKKDLHTMVVQFISEYLKDVKPFGKENERLNQLLVPSITLGLSLMVVNFTRKKINN